MKYENKINLDGMFSGNIIEKNYFGISLHTF